MAHHSGLTQGEREEHAEDVQLDQAGDICVEGNDQRPGHEGEENDPIREHEAVSPIGELMRQEVVPARAATRTGKPL